MHIKKMLVPIASFSSLTTGLLIANYTRLLIVCVRSGDRVITIKMLMNVVITGNLFDQMDIGNQNTEEEYFDPDNNHYIYIEHPRRLFSSSPVYDDV